MTFRLSNLALIAISACSISACSNSNVRETLGLERRVPDEFKVVARPPLSVPPEFNLRPPSVDGMSPNAVPASKEAKNLLIGPEGESNGTAASGFALSQGSADTAVAPVTAAELHSNAESSFLAKAGAPAADPEVRSKLNQETLEKVRRDETLIDKLSSSGERKDSTVDAKAERERIEQNKAEGKAVTEGETPVIKGKNTGVLGKLLGY